MSNWIKGKPTEPGFYYLACYVGHGESETFIAKLFYKQNLENTSAFSNEELADYLENFEKVLTATLFQNKLTLAVKELPIVAYQILEIPEYEEL